MDAPVATSVAATDQVSLLQPGGLALASVVQLQEVPLAQIATLTTALALLTTRVGALEGKPEEVAHFTASAKLPAVAALASMTLTLTGLVPARSGDTLKAGETISVQPAMQLPNGLNLSTAIVPSDGVVVIQMSASVSVAAGTIPILWNITAER